MANILEEKLREASCIGDLEAVEILLSRNVNVNSQNSVNGWTALHWACKRGNEKIVRQLLNYGADKSVKNSKGETPSDICTFSNIHELLGSNKNIDTGGQVSNAFLPSYIKNAPLNGQIELGPIRIKQPDLLSMPNTSLPATQND
ncbi:hypothetical protein D910_08730, partial [Dendroctonus ponderosae]